MQLDGQVAIITGGSKGIGRAIADGYAAEGCAVVIAARTQCDIDAAVEEVHRCAKLGLRGLELSCSWDMEPMWHPCWDPLWEAVNEVELPLHFHTFPTTPPQARALRRSLVLRGDRLRDQPRGCPGET